MSAHTHFVASDVPTPTTRAPRTGATVRRAKTLTRPERSVAPPPLIAPAGAVSAALPTSDTDDGWDAWTIFSKVVTCWAPAFLLKSIGGLNDASTQQAWREKMALVIIIAVLCAVVGFATVGLQKALCPENAQTSALFSRAGTKPGVLGIEGWEFNVQNAKSPAGFDFTAKAKDFAGQDITNFFQRSANQYPACTNLKFLIARDDPCAANSCTLSPSTLKSADFAALGLKNTSLIVGYDWEQVNALPNYIVLDGAVLNMQPYFALHPTAVPGDDVDTALRQVLRGPTHGKDGTRIFAYRQNLVNAKACLQQRYFAGNIDKITPGCFVSNLVLYVGLLVIMALVLIRFVMACVFNWFLSARLAGPPDNRTLNRTAISPAVMPEGANVSIDNRSGTAPWAGPGGAAANKKLTKGGVPKQQTVRSFVSSSTTTLVDPGGTNGAAPTLTLAQIGAELFALCLVTAYSEGEESMRATLDSISATTYADDRKLLFIVADGMITGAGEKRSTPDICVSLLEADPRFGNPQPMSYMAVGSGAKKENRAMVYAGHYTAAGRRTPTVIIVKCGTEAEAAHDKKPGNRGKRDSQLILMNFFSRVTFNDRMTPLDYDLFRKIHVLMGVTPDFFEVCLMVDADTKVFPTSLKHLVNCMHHDPMIMGVCGETRIANKRDSWVTMIQVFEYFISHHLAKAFESVFGGVSCLPGCFSMFRIKARKSSGDDWVPLIVKPEIVAQYSQSEVTTLHQKNLLLLGEDRFLTTLLIRTFPNRKMMFLPQARCRTVVPDTFSILLSQRRRWINSTIHNLMELVLVRNLCGTFCFSMQFVVFMDLLGTVVLPIAISLTYMLIVSTALSPPKTFEQAIPLMLLVGVLGLPAVLILITTRKVVYVLWMFIYILSLPVWNFVLPVYAFWHFDDFSWGETRKVEGETKGEAHGEGGGVFDGTNVPLRRWEDWERSRLRKLRRQERRRKDLERSHGPTGPFGPAGELLPPGSTRTSQYDGSDTQSLASADDDHWGNQIGGYNENSAAYPPPPTGLYAHETLAGGEVLGGSDLEAMLEQGWDDDGPGSSASSPRLRPVAPGSTQRGPGGPGSGTLSPQAQRAPQGAPRFQLSDGPGGAYSPLARAQSPGPISPDTPGPQAGGRGSGEKSYGPLGPLDPSTRYG